MTPLFPGDALKLRGESQVSPSHPITRRDLLRRAAGGGAALSLPALLTACSRGNEVERSVQAGTTVRRELADVLRFSNRVAYIDLSDDGKRRPTLDDFTKRTGVKVEYYEDIRDDERYFAKVQAPLSQGRSVDRDLMVLSDRMAARMLALGYVQRKDKSVIPNERNLLGALTRPAWDPNRDYSLPWQSGLTGLGYHPGKTGRKLTSVDDLFDPTLKGRVTFLTEMTDTVGLLLLNQGSDPSRIDRAQFDRAIGRLRGAVESGQIRRFTGSEHREMLRRGEIWAAVASSGDLVSLALEDPDFEFAIPDEGGIIWTDNMLIPQGGDVYTASALMNYVYDPDVQARIEAGVTHVCPVEGTQKAIARIDAELARSELVFPTETTLARVKAFDPEAADDADLREKFAAVAVV